MITSQMKRGMVTNSFLSRDEWEREIEKNFPEYELTDCGLLVFRFRPTHRILSFWINGGFFDTCPELPGNTVCEIPMRTGDLNLQSAVNGWMEAGFACEFTRKRMISSEDNGAENPCIRNAEPGDINTAEKLLHDNFSALTGCLPDREELIRDISCGGVLLYDDIGLLHHKTAKNKTELRHLCVSEAARGQGIGEKLVLAYHSRTVGIRRQVWVRQDYTSAVKVYEKCGYSDDGMISHVLISR